jgi:putative acetyltransferase
MSVGDLGAAASARTSMKIGPEDVESEDARELVAELDELLNGMYAVGQDLLELPSRDVAEGQGTLLVARDDAGRALGCGAIRRIAPVTGELKRMYVRPLARRRGVGGAILEALERWAAQAGLQRIVLETGIHQPAAVAFYERAGYVQIDPYGGSSGSEESLCFTKPVARGDDCLPPPRR